MRIMFDLSKNVNCFSEEKSAVIGSKHFRIDSEKQKNEAIKVLHKIYYVFRKGNSMTKKQMNEIEVGIVAGIENKYYFSYQDYNLIIEIYDWESISSDNLWKLLTEN